VSQQTGTTAPTGGPFELVARPLRMYAAFMTVGAAVAAVVAVFLLAQSGAGVTTFAEGKAGTAITVPAGASEPLIIYAVDIPGGPPLNVECKMGSASEAWVGLDYGQSPKDHGRTLHAVRSVSSHWRVGDTFTCTGTGFEEVVLGHNDGLTHLLQGLLAAFLAVGAGTLGLLGRMAIRRRLRQLRPVQGQTRT
jgi:hypothetical protein